jgi:hypothetical protein
LAKKNWVGTVHLRTVRIKAANIRRGTTSDWDY